MWDKHQVVQTPSGATTKWDKHYNLEKHQVGQTSIWTNKWDKHQEVQTINIERDKHQVGQTLSGTNNK